jgi:N-succinyldiaminopimelate aminotransferase
VTASRLAGFGTTIFTEITLLAQRCGAVNLGQGFPDTDGPPAMLAAATAAIRSGANQYPPLAGVPELRQAISQQRADRYGTGYCPDTEIAVTAGATEALAAALLALCEPGDEVVLFEPYYDAYAAAIAMAGAVRVPVLLRPGPDGRFCFDPAALEAAVTPRTRLLLLNTPHNPTGKVFTRAELATIAAVCRRHDIVAITDEVYEYLTYDGAEHVPLASLPGMRDRTLAISSAGKTFSVTGWKVGWACGPAPLIGALLTAKQYLTFAGGTPFQLAVASGLRHEQDWCARQRDRLSTARDQLRNGLTAAGLACHPSDGGYFLQADIGSVAGFSSPADIGDQSGIGGSAGFCQYLAERGGVAAIPSVVFYDTAAAGRTLVRFAFCKRQEVISEAIARIAALWPSASRVCGAAAP